MLKILEYLTRQPKLLIPMVLQHSKQHTKGRVCPGAKGKGGSQDSLIKKGPVCLSPEEMKGGKDDDGGTGLRRAKVPGKCRLGFIPDEWFLFLRPMTGVSGPYILMIGLGNYMASKEILVMEHEYYLGLSVLIVLYIVTTKFGKQIGSSLDQEVDAIANELEKGRKDEVAAMEKLIKDAETASWRAEGQQDLINAKKENIAIQLEAIFRERQMMVHKGVRRRMEYHVKRHYAARRIKHKWMVRWILENVYKGITPEFKKRVMEVAIKDLTALADKYEAAAKK